MAAALSLVGLGVMAIGLRETGVARFAHARAQARATAEGAALETIEHWSTRTYALIPVGGTLEIENPQADVWVTRIDTTLFAIAAVGWGGDPRDPGRATARAGLLVRTLDADRLARYFPAAVSATETVHLDRSTVGTDDSCAPTATVMAPEIILENTQIVGTLAEASPGPGAEPFSLALLEAASTRVRPTSIRPSPRTVAGECLSGPRNWGATDPGHPCYGLMPLIAASGHLQVNGGSGRGILVVDGSLDLRDGFRFQGIVLVTGRLRIGEAVEVEGVVRADTVDIAGGRVVAPSCELQRFLGAPALDRAFRPPSRWWIPMY
jgi:hypothetical protein